MGIAVVMAYLCRSQSGRTAVRPYRLARTTAIPKEPNSIRPEEGVEPGCIIDINTLNCTPRELWRTYA